MKRFYCTICKRTRRVRRVPTNVTNASSEQVTDRIGTCKWHDAQPVSIKGTFKPANEAQADSRMIRTSKAGR